MAKIDKIKEKLSTLRAGFGLIVAVILTLTAGVINLYYNDNIDILFYIGATIDILLIISLPFLLKMIIKNINYLEEL